MDGAAEFGHPFGKHEAHQFLALDVEGGEALQRQEIAEPGLPGAEHVAHGTETAAEQHLGALANVARRNARSIGSADQRSDAAARDDRRLDAKFVEDLKQQNMGKSPGTAAAESKTDFGGAQAPASLAKVKPVSARGFTCVPISAALTLAEVPSRTRPAIPWRMAARRKKL